MKKLNQKQIGIAVGLIALIALLAAAGGQPVAPEPEDEDDDLPPEPMPMPEPEPMPQPEPDPFVPPPSPSPGPSPSVLPVPSGNPPNYDKGMLNQLFTSNSSQRRAALLLGYSTDLYSNASLATLTKTFAKDYNAVSRDDVPGISGGISEAGFKNGSYPFQAGLVTALTVVLPQVYGVQFFGQDPSIRDFIRGTTASGAPYSQQEIAMLASDVMGKYGGLGNLWRGKLVKEATQAGLRNE